jgi:hypothetical protein
MATFILVPQHSWSAFYNQSQIFIVPLQNLYLEALIAPTWQRWIGTVSAWLFNAENGDMRHGVTCPNRLRGRNDFVQVNLLFSSVFLLSLLIGFGSNNQEALYNIKAILM